MKRLVAFALLATVSLGGIALAQKKPVKDEIIWVHMNWVARNGKAKEAATGCVEIAAKTSDLEKDKPAEAVIEKLLSKAQVACAASEAAKPGSCPRGEAMEQGDGDSRGLGSCP